MFLQQVRKIVIVGVIATVLAIGLALLSLRA